MDTTWIAIHCQMKTTHMVTCSFWKMDEDGSFLSKSPIMSYTAARLFILPHVKTS